MLPCNASSSSNSISCSTSRPLVLRGVRGRAREPLLVAPPKNVLKKSEKGLSSLPNISETSSSVIVRKPPPPGEYHHCPNGLPGPAPPLRCACSYSFQFAPSLSYFFRFSGSLSTSLASLISLKRAPAALSPGLTSA